MSEFDVDALRAEFPSLGQEQGGRPVAYFDGPGGTQVPQRVIDAITNYYLTSNANDGGAFSTSERSDASTAAAHGAVADLLGAASADEIKFGANMTTLTFHLSRSLGALFVPVYARWCVCRMAKDTQRHFAASGANRPLLARP